MEHAETVNDPRLPPTATGRRVTSGVSEFIGGRRRSFPNAGTAGAAADHGCDSCRSPQGTSLLASWSVHSSASICTVA